MIQNLMSSIRRTSLECTDRQFPRDCPQPIKEEHLLTGPMEYRIFPTPSTKDRRDCHVPGVRQAIRHTLSALATNLYGPNDI